jgi:putative nucleotidyltransferase with HDIG domain
MTKPGIRLPAVLRQIPPLPQVAVRALELIRDPGSSRAALAHVLSLDQAMTGRFLHLVNSAYYGLPRRITSLDEAIGFLGYERVHEVVVAVAASRYLTQPLPAYGLEGGMLWPHAVAVATGSDAIARQKGVRPYSEAYVAGLLHDTGKLALDIVMHHRADWATAEREEDGRDDLADWTEIERHITGYDHAALGAAIARGWNLPDRVVEAIGCHHAPSTAVLDPCLAAIVHVANAAALMAGIGLGIDGMQYVLDAEAVAALEWGDDEMAHLMEGMRLAVQNATTAVGLPFALP